MPKSPSSIHIYSNQPHNQGQKEDISGQAISNPNKLYYDRCTTKIYHRAISFCLSKKQVDQISDHGDIDQRPAVPTNPSKTTSKRV